MNEFAQFLQKSLRSVWKKIWKPIISRRSNKQQGDSPIFHISISWNLVWRNQRRGEVPINTHTLVKFLLMVFKSHLNSSWPGTSRRLNVLVLRRRKRGQGGAAVTTTIKFNSYHGSEPLFGEKTKPKRTSTEVRVWFYNIEIMQWMMTMPWKMTYQVVKTIDS